KLDRRPFRNDHGSAVALKFDRGIGIAKHGLTDTGLIWSHYIRPPSRPACFLRFCCSALAVQTQRPLAGGARQRMVAGTGAPVHVYRLVMAPVAGSQRAVERKGVFVTAHFKQKRFKPRHGWLIAEIGR